MLKALSLPSHPLRLLPCSTSRTTVTPVALAAVVVAAAEEEEGRDPLRRVRLASPAAVRGMDCRTRRTRTPTRVSRCHVGSTVPRNAMRKPTVRP